MTNDNSLLPRLALKVGVVGHLEGTKLSAPREKIFGEIDAVLRTLADNIEKLRMENKRGAQLFSDELPRMTLVSSLACGADSIVAEAAIEAGYALDVVLPFPESSMRSDLSPSFAPTFDRLLGCARAVLALPSPYAGVSGDNSRAFDLAGRIALSQSDVVIAVWDGGLSGGRGGTRDQIDRALRMNLPVIHIHSEGKGKPAILLKPWSAASWIDGHVDDMDRHEIDIAAGVAGLAGLSDLAYALIASSHETDASAHSHHNFDAEKLFLEEVGIRAPLECGLSSSDESTSEYAPTTFREAIELLTKSFQPSSPKRLIRIFGYADAIANKNARKFRMAVACVFACAAGALASPALSKLVGGHGHFLLVVTEIMMILAMIGIVYLGRRSGWHSRWLAARYVAEQIRLSLSFWPLGAWSRHTSNCHEDHRANRLVWRYLREASLCDNRRNANWLSEARSMLLRLLDSQIDYHNRIAARIKRRAHILDIGSKLLLAGVVATLLVFVGLEEFPGLTSDHVLELLDRHLPVWTIVVSSLSFGAFGLKTTLDFEGAIERSEFSRERLLKQKGSAEARGNSVNDLYAFASELAAIMLDDLHQWRVTAESRVLDIPA